MKDPHRYPLGEGPMTPLAELAKKQLEREARYRSDNPGNATVPDPSGLFDGHFAILKAQDEAREAPTARRALDQLRAEVRLFEAELDVASEVGVRLVPLGGDLLVHVSDISSHQPNLIVLRGFLQDGSPVKLLQHLSQLNLLLVRAPRLNPDTPRTPIGFRDNEGPTPDPPADP